MNKILQISCGLLFLATTVFGQKAVELQLYHYLNDQSFYLNQEASTNLDEQFKVTRLEYYVTRISLIHDGGMETAISDDTVSLVNAANSNYTAIPLGEIDVTEVESVKFHIGVYSPKNNEDPGQYSIQHPLGPKSPSMHWGWSAGYRFIVVEGTAGEGFSQTFQLHGLGNENYFQTEVDVTPQLVNGKLILPVAADYAKSLEDIFIGNGVISHGSTEEAQEGIFNFRDLVFSNHDITLESPLNISNNAWTVYPNPVSHGFKVQYNGNENDLNVEVLDMLGKVITRYDLADNRFVTLPTSGVYTVLLKSNSQVISTKKVIKQ
jgi:hypothetical protein